MQLDCWHLSLLSGSKQSDCFISVCFYVSMPLTPISMEILRADLQYTSCFHSVVFSHLPAEHVTGGPHLSPSSAQPHSFSNSSNSIDVR